MKIFHLVLPTTGEFTKGNVDTVTATELVDKYDRWLGDKVSDVLALGIGQSLTYDGVIIICVSDKVETHKKTYRFDVTYTAGVVVEVEACNIKEAKELAKKKAERNLTLTHENETTTDVWVVDVTEREFD